MHVKSFELAPPLDSALSANVRWPVLTHCYREWPAELAGPNRDTEATEHSGPRLVSREYAAVWQKRIFRTRAKCYQ